VHITLCILTSFEAEFISLHAVVFGFDTYPSDTLLSVISLFTIDTQCFKWYILFFFPLFF